MYMLQAKHPEKCDNYVVKELQLQQDLKYVFKKEEIKKSTCYQKNIDSDRLKRE